MIKSSCAWLGKEDNSVLMNTIAPVPVACAPSFIEIWSGNHNIAKSANFQQAKSRPKM